MGKVYLVGAGPGNPKLMTIRGMELLRQCDALVYDRLASEEFLSELKPECERIYVGKRAGQHSKKQEEINEILAECGRKYPLVVRLKGGDPFVFGRGGEEIEILTQYGIDYEVVPGITSAVAVPECAGIPVTHRGVSRSFHVITGHTNTGKPECDYKNLAESEGTLVFLMGLSNLAEIAENLIKAGKPEDTPAAVISEGTTKNQQTVRGTLATIVQKVQQSAIPSPAIIVIGETSRYEFRSEKTGQRKIGITSTRALQEKLEKGFADTGDTLLPVCSMDILRTEAIKALDKELTRLEQYQWVLFTSQNAVAVFFEELQKENTDIRKLGHLKFAVLGSGTASKLLEYGIHADFIPSRYVVSALAEEFSEILKAQEQVLIPRAVQGSEELTEVFDKKGIRYTELAVYDVAGRLTDNIRYLKELDCLIFVSASGVTEFFSGLREKNISLPSDIQIACIGEITRERVRQEYRDADIIASTSDVKGLVEAVRTYYLKKQE